MSPRRLLPIIVLALAAATPAAPVLAAPRGTTAAPLPADALPVPPTRRPTDTMQAFAPAPVPDPDLQRPPADRKADAPRTQLTPSLFRRSDRPSGDGFVNGSAGTYDGDHRLRPTPELTLSVPLH